MARGSHVRNNEHAYDAKEDNEVKMEDVGDAERKA